MPKTVDTAGIISNAIAEHRSVIAQLDHKHELLKSIADAMIEALRSGNKVLWCGNGGSAADSQHLAAELVGRFRRDRPAMASIALTTNTSILTAIANDFGYDTVFGRQVEALGRPGDVLVGISTSGNSPNVCAALSAARSMGIKTVAMTGSDGGKLAANADLVLRIDSKETARIQEAHILCGHIVCDLIESSLTTE
jgi:D-sedoheptulose 7-phosphate isomerase